MVAKNRNLISTAYTKPKKVGKPKANTNIPKGSYDSTEGARVNPLKPGRSGATSSVGLGGMVNFAPWQKQKSR
jgi:hypothetical protein